MNVYLGDFFLMKTIVLLIVSNVFMTMAWYGHLKYKSKPLLIVILVSWLIAFIEYCFQVPANRVGHYQFTAAQLKTIQEVITLVVFSVFSVAYLSVGRFVMELFGRFCVNCGSGLSYFQKVVMEQRR